MADLNGNTRPKWGPRIARATIAAAVLVLLAGPFIKFGVLPWQAGLAMFVVAAALAGVGGAYSLYNLLRRRGGRLFAIAAAAGLAALVIPVAIIAEGRGVPPINDITTDMTDPPAFKVITAEVRGDGSAPLAYDPSFASQQLAGYPNLRPLIVSEPPQQAFNQAMDAARKLGWEFAGGATPGYSGDGGGQFEATDTVAWWGFKDDVVVRLTPSAEGTRIDVRSKSRVGKGDVGVNAKRIEDFFKAYSEQ